MAQKFRNYCFTYFYKDEDEIQNIRDLGEGYKYMCFGKETCPTTGRKHLQGWFSLKNQRTIKSVIKDFKGWHLEPCRGNIEQNETYCKKEGNYEHIGEKPKQGERTDLNNLKDKVLNGTKVDSICVENPMAVHQYGRTLDRLEAIYLRNKFRTKKPNVYWYFGGTVRERRECAFYNFDPSKEYIWNKDSEWQDGYTGQETIIIFDLEKEIKISNLVNLLSEAPMYLQRKYKDPMPVTSKKIIITTNRCPTEMYSDISTDYMMDLLYNANMIDLAQKYSEGNTIASESDEEI